LLDDELCFDTVHQCDGQTDRQTDTALHHVPRYAYASWGNNEKELKLKTISMGNY